jgi:hemerythrin
LQREVPSFLGIHENPVDGRYCSRGWNRMTAATGAFRWTDRYSVNIAELDRQHQAFFVMVNELNQALATGEATAITNSVLQRLVEYAHTHFAAEEALMTEYKFPALLTHRTEHDRFRQLVTKFLGDHHAGKAGVPVSLMLFLQTWLKEHILVSDKAYSTFLNARGVH